MFQQDLVDDHLDAELNEVGKQQCVDGRAKITERNFDIVLTSSLRRAMQTSELMFPNFKSKF